MLMHQNVKIFRLSLSIAMICQGYHHKGKKYLSIRESKVTCPILFFFLINLFIYLCLCWVFVSVRGLSLVAASGGHSSLRCAGLSLSRPLLLRKQRLQTRRLSNCGSRAQLLRGMWDLPRPGLEPVSPALAGGFSTTAPPGKPNLPYS